MICFAARTVRHTVLSKLELRQPDINSSIIAYVLHIKAQLQCNCWSVLSIDREMMVSQPFQQPGVPFKISRDLCLYSLLESSNVCLLDVFCRFSSFCFVRVFLLLGIISIITLKVWPIAIFFVNVNGIFCLSNTATKSSGWIASENGLLNTLPFVAEAEVTVPFPLSAPPSIPTSIRSSSPVLFKPADRARSLSELASKGDGAIFLCCSFLLIGRHAFL